MYLSIYRVTLSETRLNWKKPPQIRQSWCGSLLCQALNLAKQIKTMLKLKNTCFYCLVSVFCFWFFFFWLPASSIELWETRHFFWIRYPLSIWTESVWTSIICKWFMRAGISLPERFSETINISKDRSWDSTKKPWKIFYMGSYSHLMKILIHLLYILKIFDVSQICPPFLLTF